MILKQLQDYFRSRSPTSLEEIANHFQCEPEALRGMLAPLIRKGRIQKLDGKKCSGCHSCKPESLELYEWVNSQ
ncbi:MAG: sugar metabolism transcriptional regulator [Pseudanabaena sp.]|nr:MAG: sugar metabolism transcriptional regulator [Pseudanabaena sp.]